MSLGRRLAPPWSCELAHPRRCHQASVSCLNPDTISSAPSRQAPGRWCEPTRPCLWGGVSRKPLLILLWKGRIVSMMLSGKTQIIIRRKIKTITQPQRKPCLSF